jgi:hypothetical protein
MGDGAQLQSEISKTSGNFKIKGFRENGVSAEELLAKLRDACLVDPNGEWIISNLKPRPVWNG